MAILQLTAPTFPARCREWIEDICQDGQLSLGQPEEARISVCLLLLYYITPSLFIFVKKNPSTNLLQNNSPLVEDPVGLAGLLVLVVSLLLGVVLGLGVVSLLGAMVSVVSLLEVVMSVVSVLGAVVSVVSLLGVLVGSTKEFYIDTMADMETIKPEVTVTGPTSRLGRCCDRATMEML